MKKNATLFRIISMLFVFIFGYATACFCFSIQAEVNLVTGHVRENISLFPFKITKVRSDRAFPVLFQSGRLKDEDKWIQVGDNQHFSIHPNIIHASRKGDLVLSQQRTLLNLFQQKQFSDSERTRISKKYFDIMSAGNFKEAENYLIKIGE